MCYFLYQLFVIQIMRLLMRCSYGRKVVSNLPKIGTTGALAHWRVFGICGKIMPPVEPQPTSCAGPSGRESGAGSLTACTWVLKIKSEVNLRRATSCGLTPLEKNKLCFLIVYRVDMYIWEGWNFSINLPLIVWMNNSISDSNLLPFHVV